MSKKDNKIVLGIIHTSLGELQWLVPHFYELNQKRLGEQFVMLFFSKDVYMKAVKEQVHLNEFLQFGTVLQKEKLFSFLLNKRKRVSTIYKDFWPINRNSLASSVRFCCPNATLHLYPHSNAIYSISEPPNNNQETEVSIKHNARCFDFLLINTPYDISYWEKRIESDRIRVVGSPAYKHNWLERLNEYSEYDLKEIKDAARGKKVLVVFTRPADGAFLDRSDYEYLIRSIIEVVDKTSDNFVVFKQHPREDSSFLKGLLDKTGFENFRISSLNSFALCSLGYLSISFWSSTVTDSIAAGCPAIEFFRFHIRGNDKWYLEKGGTYTSFYTKLGLCPEAVSKLELEDALQKVTDARQEVLSIQQENLSKVFGLNTNVGQSLPIRNSDYNLKTCLMDWVRIIASSTKSIFR